MARKSKRKGRKPDHVQKPAEQASLGMNHPDSAFSKYLAEHPEGVYLTAIPGAQDAGLPFVGIVSTPESLKNDLFLIEAGTAIGKHEAKKSRDPKARYEERDDEIVRLKDEIKSDGKHRTFGEVRQSIEKKWPTMQNGKPLTTAAVIGAYKRKKSKKRN